MKWFTQWRINRLLVKRASKTARLKVYRDNIDEVTSYGANDVLGLYADLGAIDERLRQIGYKGH